MWELIQANKRKSVYIFFGMGVCLIALGYCIGLAVLPDTGGPIGVLCAFGIWLVLALVSYFAGDSILLSMSNAQEVSPDIHPQLFNVVDEMRIAANLPTMPKVYIIPDSAANAFAVGRDPQRSSIVVTAGLLSVLKRDELQGVVAHEMSHIINRDILFMTFAGVMLGSIVLLSEVFLRGMRFSSTGRYRSRNSSEGGQAAMIMLIITIICAILAPILARLFYFALSRRREYLADASGARLTRYPEGLASALEKISQVKEPLASANKITAPMYIESPFRGAASFSLWSTHPPIEERVEILRNMNSGAGFAQYQKAFSAVKEKPFTIIPQSVQDDSVPLVQQKPSATPVKKMIPALRTMGDIIRATDGFAFLNCTCGLKLKIHPDSRDQSVTCPRCGNELSIPTAKQTIATEGPDTVSSLTYHKQGAGWETFNCSCGRLIQISPLFAATHIQCPACKREIKITTKVA